MSATAALQAFATVFPAELPDKTMFATIVLVTRYRRPGLVWAGAAAAFTVHVGVAVAAGSLVGLLPETVVQVVTAVLFLGGAALLVKAGRDAEDADTEAATPTSTTALAAFAGSFGLIVAAEWGDLTQLATASLAARSGAPLATAAGALVALLAVAALAATFGRQLVARVPVHKVSYAGAVVFAALAVWTVVDLVR